MPFLATEQALFLVICASAFGFSIGRRR
jgi:hypothetical protein